MAVYTIDSLSSSLVFGTTLYRNQAGLVNKLMAQASYALIAVVAAVETVTAATFCGLALLATPFSSTPFCHCAKWLNSSAFSLGWSITDFILNLFVNLLVADEKSARQILQSGNLMIIPHGAVI